MIIDNWTALSAPSANLNLGADAGFRAAPSLFQAAAAAIPGCKKTYMKNPDRLINAIPPARNPFEHSRLQRCFLLLALGLSLALLPTARGTTVLDPDPEPSTTLFGYAVASLGDVNGDSVPDYAVGAPYQDGDFVSTATGFGLPQNVGKVFVIDGATFSHAERNE